MTTIRPMLESDADAVRQVDRLAFMPLLRKINPSGPISIRRRENVLAARAVFPQGCFVAEDEQGMAGYIFSRAWGQAGWVGVFGVHPQRQGGQVGQRLLAESISALEEAGCTTIGLETMPDSSYNIGLYARRGFRPITVTLTVEKAVEAQVDGSRPTGGYRVAQPGDAAALDMVTAISRAAWPELDLCVEARNAQERHWGELLLLGNGETFSAAAIMRTSHRRESETGEPLPNPTCEISALASLPGARPHLGEVTGTLERFAAARGFQTLRIPVNSADWPSLQWLVANGYRVVHSGLRLMRKGEYTAQPGLEFSRWAM